MPQKVLTEEERFCTTLPYDFAYYCQLRKTFEDGYCGFCGLDHSINTVLHENADWIMFENAFKNTRPCEVMLVIISRKHWRKLSDVTPQAWASFAEMIAYAEAHFNLPGGMLFARFGDMRLNAGTMLHLHWNLWVPSGTGPLSIPVFKSKEEREKDVARALEFEARYNAGERA